MKVGIKYCGGCNPRYDRAAKVEQLKKENPQWDWEYASEGNCYDLLVVAGGCTACCASVEQYTADKVVRLRSAESGLNQAAE